MIFQINCLVQNSGSFFLVLQKNLKIRNDSVKDMRDTAEEFDLKNLGKLETVLSIIIFWGGVHSTFLCFHNIDRTSR